MTFLTVQSEPPSRPVISSQPSNQVLQPSYQSLSTLQSYPINHPIRFYYSSKSDLTNRPIRASQPSSWISSTVQSNPSRHLIPTVQSAAPNRPIRPSQSSNQAHSYLLLKEIPRVAFRVPRKLKHYFLHFWTSITPITANSARIREFIEKRMSYSQY